MATPSNLIPPLGSSVNTLIYRATITQFGVAAPTVVVLENTIGAIVWSRVALGNYLGTLAGAFTSKVGLYIGAINNVHIGPHTNFVFNDNNSVRILTFDVTTYNPVSQALNDGMLANTALLIEVLLP